MPPGDPDISWSSERTLRVALGGTIDAVTQARVHEALRVLRAARVDGAVDIAPAYTTLGVVFEVAGLDHARAERAVREALRGMESGAAVPGPSKTQVRRPETGRAIEIPVDYGGELGPDLAFVAEHAGLDQRGAAELHASVEYTVCFLGFAPGFGYLAGLPAKLNTPRLASPRTRVPADAVAIGGGQTAVYPGGTPGGWRLIGRARVAVFDAGRAEPALLAAGDRVRFVVASFAPARGGTP